MEERSRGRPIGVQVEVVMTNRFMLRSMFAAAIFLGSFLLFQIQPLIGKYLLPWFGSAASVWTACLMFFQVMLLLGYLYAHWVFAMRKHRQAVIHFSLMASVLVLGTLVWQYGTSPVTPSLEWTTRVDVQPLWKVVLALCLTVGGPYFLLATTSTLLQAWRSRYEKETEPYPLYAISNAGAFLALVTYPAVVEPLLGIRYQGILWGWLYVLFLVLLALCVVLFLRKGREEKDGLPQRDGVSGMLLDTGNAGMEAKADTDRILSPRRMILWICLAMCGSLSLVSTTSQLTQDVCPLPLLWVIPLGLYLLTYIIAFHGTSQISVYVAALSALFGVIISYISLRGTNRLGIVPQIIGLSGGMFCVCLFCHASLYRLRPAMKYLTGYYLCLAVGGALGGVFAGMLAPVIFKGLWEYHVTLMFAAFLVVSVIGTDDKSAPQIKRLVFVFPLLTLALLGSEVFKKTEDIVAMSRNFYGTLRVHRQVKGVGTDNVTVYSLMHGAITHGIQPNRSSYRFRPTSYFTERSGVGLAILNHPKYAREESVRMAVVGLGIGTLAAYCRAGDVIRFYEINPDVVKYARDTRYFTYISDCLGKVEIVVGDGRLELEQELSEGRAKDFDVLVLDAFNGDAIPTHLLTKEAFRTYLDHLAQGGVIAVNGTNRYVDLIPLALAIRTHFGLNMEVIRSRGDFRVSTPAMWILLSENGSVLNAPAIQKAAEHISRGISMERLWTDDYNNPRELLKFDWLRTSW